MKKIFLLFVIFVAMPARADIASTTYVNTATTSKVDVSSTATQTMAGTYTVSGTLDVPTPALPTAE